MKGNRSGFRKQLSDRSGYSLVEVLVVMVIVGILATGVAFMFANPTARVKSQAFNMLGEFNLARSEAVSKNSDAFADFLFSPDGYRIYVAGDTNNTYDTGVDQLIRVTFFANDVQYYDPTSTPTDGPTTAPGGSGNLIGKDGIVLDNNDPTPPTYIIFEPDGTLDEDEADDNINIVIYKPDRGSEEIAGYPYALRIRNNTGKVKLWRWSMGDTWRTK